MTLDSGIQRLKEGAPVDSLDEYLERQADDNLADAGAGDTVYLADPTAESAYAEVTRGIDVERALETLTDRQWEVIRLLFVEDMSTHEAARRLGIDQKAVMKRRDAAFTKLRQHLSNYA